MPLERTVALLDPDDVIQELGLTDADFRRVQRLITAASSRLEKSLQTVIVPRKVLKYYDGNETPVLDAGAPIVAVHNMTIGGAVDDPQNYVVDRAGGRVLRYGVWPAGFQNVGLDATLGMDPIPPEALEAAMLLVRKLAFPTGDLRSERIGDYSYERFEPKGEADLPDDVEALVSHLKRWRFS